LAFPQGIRRRNLARKLATMVAWIKGAVSDDLNELICPTGKSCGSLSSHTLKNILLPFYVKL
jgi:hypothetical protein